MDTKLKKNWLQALKSGDYVKGKNVLKSTEGTYCCLGVLADLLIAEYDNTYWIDGTEVTETECTCPVFIFQGDKQDAYVTGFDDKIFSLTGLNYDVQRELIHLNDGADIWDEVIEYIEKEL